MSLRIREVVLELLRHGDAHNQLLSPLTQYLALCGPRPAASVRVPWEQRDVDYWLSRMNYDPDAKARDGRDQAVARRQLADLITGLFDQVPGLANEGRVSEGQMLHLRLMLTPQELSLLPFEFSNAPSGFASGDQPFLLGPRPDVVLTREVRRSESVVARLPAKPKILLVVGEGVVPYDDTVAELEEALEPWIRTKNDNGVVKPDRDAYLTILARASFDEVRQECATGDYSHVHILAHGAPLRRPEQSAFGLALWNADKDAPEVVSGSELALALRPPSDQGSHVRPWCVVLCTCDSGKVDGVVHPTASIAHALHVEGVPMVLASQYPLTFGAAIELTRTFYRLELRGEDPRRTARDVRHAIASKMRHTHDWASLVVYAGWPSDLEAQVDEVRLVRLFERLEAASDWADTVIKAREVKRDSDGKGTADADSPSARSLASMEPVLERSLEAIDAVAELLEREAHRCERRRAELGDRKERNEISKHENAHLEANVMALLTEIYGLLGSSAKRKARLLTELGRDEHARLAIRDAGGWYLKGVALKAPEHWTACQSFVILGLGTRMGWATPQDKALAKAQWNAAKETAQRVLDDSEAAGASVWAHSTLVEVWLWAPFFWEGDLGGDEGESERDAYEAMALEEAKRHLREVSREKTDLFPLLSTTRQLERYRDWWGQQDYVEPGVLARAKALLGEVGDAQDAEPAPTSFELFTRSEPVESDRETILGSGETTSVLPFGEADESRFLVRMLPARQGDALWIEYGSDDDPRRILIDGGFRKTIETVRPQIEEIAEDSPSGQCTFELGVVSHIDADHIEGFIELLAGQYPVSFDDIWFNGRKHLDPAALAALDPTDILGGKHGLFLDQVLDLVRAPWNVAFGGKPVVVPGGAAELPTKTLAGGMELTLFSPTPTKLTNLSRRWDSEVRKAGLDGASIDEIREAMDRLHYNTGAFDDTLGRKKPTGPVDVEALRVEEDGEDDSPANGSSIAFLAEFEGRSCFFMADAHADAVLDSIDRHVGEGERLSVGAVKLPHHASANNVTDALLRRIDTRVFLISTSGGGGHYHPDRVAIAKVIAGDWRPADDEEIHLLFNYRSPYTSVWDDEELKQRYRYRTHFAGAGDILELAAVPRV